MSNQLNQPSFQYKTTDLPLAAALYTLRFPVERLDEFAGRTRFVFNQTPELHQTVRMLFNREIKVDYLDYYNAIKQLKSMIFNK